MNLASKVPVRRQQRFTYISDHTKEIQGKSCSLYF
jgi:hypothetical protein